MSGETGSNNVNTRKHKSRETYVGEGDSASRRRVERDQERQERHRQRQRVTEECYRVVTRHQFRIQMERYQDRLAKQHCEQHHKRKEDMK
jgi:hypothetical protein